MFKRNKEQIQNQLEQYRKCLLYAKSVETDQAFLKQYVDHLNTLNEIEKVFIEENQDLLLKLLEDEGRYYGWSYLPNSWGEKVESAFWKLKEIIN